MAIDSYILSFDRPVTLAELEESRKETFTKVRPDRLIIYPCMSDVGFGRKRSSAAKLATHKITLSELRRVARNKKCTPAHIGVSSNSKKISIVRV